MKIDLCGIQEGTHSLVLESPGSSFPVDEDPKLRLRDPRITGTLSVEGRDCRVRGSLTGILEIACGRCLAPMDLEVEAELDASLAWDDPAGRSSESSGGEAPGVLDLTGPVREAILLEIPIKNVCREDCRGICPRCGANRNTEPCNCDLTPRDPRWSALEGLSFSSDPEE